ncbi:MAG: PilW family protein [Azoarcus sp.]|nr:PilW family protein [Azoarcus sp.]
MPIETNGRISAMREIMSGRKAVSLHANERGMTIIEFLVASTIGLFVLSVVGYAYISNKESWNFNVQESRLQDRGRHITSLLNADLRLAGFRGCIRGDILTIPPAGFGVADLKERLEEGVRTEQIGSHTTKLHVFAPVEGGSFLSAALPLGAADPAPAIVPLSPAMVAERHVDPSTGGGASSMSFVLIDDCANTAEFAQATVTGDPIGIAISGATGVAHDDNTIMTWYHWGGADGSDGINYSFDPDTRKLWRNGQLLADNVESFRACLGVDSIGGDGVVDSLSFGTTNFAQTISAHVDLVLASSLPVLDQPTTSSFNLCGSHAWTTSDDGDRYLRRLFSTSVTLRNKIR